MSWSHINPKLIFCFMCARLEFEVCIKKKEVVVLSVHEFKNSLWCDDKPNLFPPSSCANVIGFRQTFFCNYLPPHPQGFQLQVFLVMDLEKVFNLNRQSTFEIISKVIAFELEILLGHEIIKINIFFLTEHIHNATRVAALFAQEISKFFLSFENPI